MLRYAYNMRFISELPRLAFAYAPPSRPVLRKDRADQIKKHGPLLFTANEVRRMIEAATRPAYLRACILLGINGGFGQQDCGMLEDHHVDLDSRVIVFPRPKTGVERVVPLWPETIAAMTAWRIVCPTPQPLAESRIFVSKTGRLLVSPSKDRLTDRSAPLLRRLGIKRQGVSFYCLRRTFRTWADETGDQHAVARIMGHTFPGMSGVYVQEISLDRLRAVTDHVRAKLFGQVASEQVTHAT
jgi:integrase